MRQDEIWSHSLHMNSILLALTCLKKKIHILPPRVWNSKHRSPTLHISIPEIIYVHDTGGLGETAVVNFNAGQEVESMWGTSGPSVMFWPSGRSGTHLGVECFLLDRMLPADLQIDSDHGLYNIMCAVVEVLTGFIDQFPLSPFQNRWGNLWVTGGFVGWIPLGGLIVTERSMIWLPNSQARPSGSAFTKASCSWHDSRECSFYTVKPWIIRGRQVQNTYGNKYYIKDWWIDSLKSCQAILS